MPTRRSSCSGPRIGGKREECAQERLAQHVPLPAQAQPGVPVTRVSRVEPGGGLDAVLAQEDRLRPLGAQRVGEHRRRLGPAQPVLLEFQRLQHRGRPRQGIERAEQVGDEAAVQLRGARRSPEVVRCL